MAIRLFHIQTTCQESTIDTFSLIVQEVKKRKKDEGYNVATGEYADLVKAGVVDPTKVTRSALQNAAFISGLLLTQKTKQQMRHSLENLVTRRGAVNGFHIEHIIARNDDNLALFGNDQDRFEQERNRLGATLLLRGHDNISSGNEGYSIKLATYANTLLWNETLREDSYKSKLDFTRFAQQTGLPFKPLEKFGQEEIEERQRLLFALCSLIWLAPMPIKTVEI